MQTVQANPSTAQTNTALVAAQTQKIVKIRSIFISSDTIMTVSIENSVTNSTLVMRLYVANYGGLALGPDDLDDAFWSLTGEGLDYSTSVNGNVFIKVGYEQV